MGNKSYDFLNKQKQKYEKIISDKNKEIGELKNRINILQAKYDNVREELFNLGSGKGTLHKLEKVINDKEREKRTLENKLKDLDGSKLISSFSFERQELINRINALKFNNSIFNNLAIKFQDGLVNVIEIAYRIKNKSVDDMDYFTFVFRDDIVGLFEKMLKVVLNDNASSATNYLVGIIDGRFVLPKQYTDEISALKDKKVLRNILYLINIETTGYHGNTIKNKMLKYDKESSEMVKPDKFLNLNSDDQLMAIFTLLEFMCFVFTNKDSENNLLCIAQCWFKTI